MKRRTWKPAEQYRKTQLHKLIERVKQNHADAIDEAVAFCLAESRGLWHGRARAKICRNLKARNIPREFKDLLVEEICTRLTTGNFSEQFKDQLAMAIRFRPKEMQSCAQQAACSDKLYVQQYAKWVINKIASTTS
jgi:hypothetical protein